MGQMISFSQRLILLTMASALSLGACGSNPRGDASPQNTACPSQAAEIQILDGIARIQCGCLLEAKGAQSSLANPLKCTVAAGSIVFFNFHGAQLEHQVISLPSPAFASSPLMEPRSNTPVYALKFTVPGTYRYRDAFEPSIAGSIVVQ